MSLGLISSQVRREANIGRKKGLFLSIIRVLDFLDHLFATDAISQAVAPDWRRIKLTACYLSKVTLDSEVLPVGST